MHEEEYGKTEMFGGGRRKEFGEAGRRAEVHLVLEERLLRSGKVEFKLQRAEPKEEYGKRAFVNLSYESEVTAIARKGKARVQRKASKSWIGPIYDVVFNKAIPAPMGVSAGFHDDDWHMCIMC